MEGPTPVSALIHAATMVTAGVYLIVRSNFIFSLTEDARTGVVIVGCITLLLGAIIGCAKDDIKKALAGSTMSQIGYMVLAAGLGPAGYALAIFHLLTHGFFKANMFLGAGSVMHGTNDDVNMRHYGALQKAMPITFVTFAIGYLAIIGVPPFAGFWSKDKIIETAFADNFVVGLCALVGAGVTAFYMTRLMLMTFVTTEPDGRGRWENDVHPHESPQRDDDPADGPRGPLGARRLPDPQRLDHRLALAGRRHPRGAVPRDRCPRHEPDHAGRRGDRCRRRVDAVLPAAGAARGADRGVGRSPGPRVPSCTATRSTRR